MGDNPLNQALSNLETTIGSINTKVEANKGLARAYKAKIIEKLKNLNKTIDELKANNNLKSIPQLRQQLEESQTKLGDATKELEDTKTNLADATRYLQESQQKIQQLNSEIENLNVQVQELQNTNQQKTDEIASLNQTLAHLTEQKNSAERNLAAKQQEIDQYIERLATINTTLASQIGLIDTIVGELGDLDSRNDEVSQQFQAVSDNIMAIMNMVNNPNSNNNYPPAAAAMSSNNKITNMTNLRVLRSNPDKRAYNTFISSLNTNIGQQINDNIGKFDSGDPTAISNIQNILTQNNINVPPLRTSGGRRRKTMKKRHRKTYKKMRGGYVYSVSKELDKESSVVSASSGSKTKTRTNLNKYKTRRKSSK